MLGFISAFAMSMYSPILLSASGTTADIGTFLSAGTEVLTSMISWFGQIIAFMMSNTICFIWLIISIIGAAFVFLSRTIGK